LAPDGLLLATFSIVARDHATGMFGVGVSTAVPAVGAICPFAKAGVGAIATQAFVNPYLGLDGLRLLEKGLSADKALDRLIADDPGRGARQLSIVDAAGRAASYSGDDCVPWCGNRIGDGVAVAGNMLLGEETITAMLAAYEEARLKGLDIVERLMMALEAAQFAGGDFRGRQSAALKVVAEEEYPYCDLRVDEHVDPVAELRRVLEVARVQLFPFLHGLPSRDHPEGTTPEDVRLLLRRPPAERGGPTPDEG
jgi:uncharacterized Ntn-hydrolase superfamily protein